MPKKTRLPDSPPGPTMLAVPRRDADARIQERIEKGRELKSPAPSSIAAYEDLSKEYSKWDSFNAEMLKRLFTTDELSKEYSWWGVVAIGMYEKSLGEKIADLYKDIDQKLHRLDSIRDRLELIPLGNAIASEVRAESEDVAKSGKVFVVHGRDEVAKTALEVFLHEVGLQPIVLHRQADEGLTIIEKFEKHSDVGYAFILLTPDEVAYLADQENRPDDKRVKEKRARPNVIFEFGYFVGKLGRSRVCCLYTGDVALPSDVSGMIYKRFNSSIEEVAYGVIKDLKAAGYSIK